MVFRQKRKGFHDVSMKATAFSLKTRLAIWKLRSILNACSLAFVFLRVKLFPTCWWSLVDPPACMIKVLPAEGMLPTCSQRIPWQHDSEWTTHDTPLPQWTTVTPAARRNTEQRKQTSGSLNLHEKRLNRFGHADYLACEEQLKHWRAEEALLLVTFSLSTGRYKDT